MKITNISTSDRHVVAVTENGEVWSFDRSNPISWERLPNLPQQSINDVPEEVVSKVVNENKANGDKYRDALS